MIVRETLCAAFACSILLAVAGCKAPENAAESPPRQPLGPPPSYRELADRQNARVAAISGFYTRGTVDVSWTDESGQRQNEIGEGNLIFMRPDRVALTFEKVGKVYLWIGGDPDRSWMLWGGDVSRAYIARNENILDEACEEFPIALLPAELIDLYGVFDLPIEQEGSQAVTVTGDKERRAWVVTGPARWCLRRVWFALEDGRPERVELFDSITGRIWAESELSDYREMEVRGVAPGRQPFVPTRVEVRSGESRGDGIVRLSLQDPADVAPGHTQIKPALFDFDAISRNMRPREVVVLDVRCEAPALSESPEERN